jgi:LIM domain
MSTFQSQENCHRQKSIYLLLVRLLILHHPLVLMVLSNVFTDRPFVRQDQLTPVSASSDSRSVSPRTPNDGRRSPLRRPSQSNTGIIPKEPPSPNVSASNIEFSFSPFTVPIKQSPSRGRPGNSNLQRYAEADPLYAPVSPRTGTDGLLQRMNSIAPGPFDINGNRPGTQTARQAQWTPNNHDARHVPQASTGSGHSRSSTTSSNEGRTLVGGPKLPKVEGAGGYGGFGPQSAQDDERGLLRPENRSQTFPWKNESRLQDEGPNGLPRRPSEPGSGPRRPLNAGFESKSLSPPRQRRPSIPGPDRSRALPPRGMSLLGRKTDGSPNDPPPMPNVNLTAEFGINNPYHTPSTSQSSDASAHSEKSIASSRSSPPKPIDRRKPSNTSNIDKLMEDMKVSLPIDNPQHPPREQFAKPMRPLEPSMLAPESPMDPAIQGGRLSPIPPRSKTPANNHPPRRPSTAKGNCKSCGEPIKGKSVSSADGRLTGRYHKQCFVCNTCSEPFATATFYVIDDAPYCERHYHKLNNSMCQSCDRGIEGQYLETERRQKYHPNCLTCSDCRRVLRDDYFEINAKVYCERDAYRRAQQRNFLGPGTNRIERRTTRLMVM